MVYNALNASLDEVNNPTCGSIIPVVVLPCSQPGASFAQITIAASNFVSASIDCKCQVRAGVAVSRPQHALRLQKELRGSAWPLAQGEELHTTKTETRMLRGICCLSAVM